MHELTAESRLRPRDATAARICETPTCRMWRSGANAPPAVIMTKDCLSRLITVKGPDADFQVKFGEFHLSVALGDMERHCPLRSSV